MFNSMKQVMEAIDSGETVYWRSKAYKCLKDDLGQYFVKCVTNGNYVGLKADKNPKSYITFK